MFILCPGTESIYNSECLTRYYVNVVPEEDDVTGDKPWAIDADASNYAYHLGYYKTKDEANEALLDLMNQIRTGCKWLFLKS